MDRRRYIIEIAELTRKAVEAGLPKDDVVAGLESALRCEKQIKETRDYFARTY